MNGLGASRGWEGEFLQLPACEKRNDRFSTELVSAIYAIQNPAEQPSDPC